MTRTDGRVDVEALVEAMLDTTDTALLPMWAEQVRALGAERDEAERILRKAEGYDDAR